MTPERLAFTLNKLYEARRASRTLLGDRWREHMTFIGEQIGKVQEKTGLDVIQSAMKICERCHANGGLATDSVHILAAAVELVEPTKVEA